MTQMHECRACLTPDPYTFLRLGDHPPANMFVREAEIADDQPAFSLDTQVCLTCGLIQVADQIPADFFRHYLYVPSGATTMHGHFEGLAEAIAARADGGLVVDIGCNDGLLLMHCNRQGLKTLGVDPAANIAEIARERGVEVHVGYFDADSAAALRRERGAANIIVTTNTFNHIGSLIGFMAGVKALLADNGTFIVEVPWAKDLLAKNEFDTVYHEHVSEFSVLSLVMLGALSGFDVVDVERLSVHGGSMRVFMRHSADAGAASAAVAEMLAEEKADGMLDAAVYDAFAERIGGVRTRLLAMLADLKSQGLKVAGYGAPAKGNTLLNYFGIGPETLDYLVDRNPLKQGLYSPGMKIPVVSTEAIAANKPDVMLVLAWNFFDEIKLQQVGFLNGGGRFLVPLPEPVLIG